MSENSIVASSPNPAYLDLKALADYACCSVRWLRMRLHDRDNPLPHYRIGGKLLVKVHEFDAWASRYAIRPQVDVLNKIVDETIEKVTGGHAR